MNFIFCSTLSAAEKRGADHHIHVRSPYAAEALVLLCKQYKNVCDIETDIKQESPGAAFIVEQLDVARLEKGVLLSMAYLFGMPELSETKFSDYRFVRAENSYVAQLAAAAPHRLVGFISVNPLEEYALDEVDYWLNKQERLGVKLHFANSAVDLNDSDHLMKLRSLLELVERHRAAVILHIETRSKEFGYSNIKHFVDQVLANVPNLCIQVAHMGSAGGYDSVADSSIRALITAVKNKQLDRDNMYFDIAAVGSNPMRRDQIELLVSRIREIGTDRILFGSDWDTFKPPAQVISALLNQVPLKKIEWDTIIQNQAPYLRHKFCGASNE